MKLSFTGVWMEDCYVEQAQRPNIGYSCSFMEPRSKMMLIIITIIIGNECVWETVWGQSAGGGKGKESILRNEEGRRTLHVYI
jgi:hypothetical protein